MERFTEQVATDLITDVTERVNNGEEINVSEIMQSNKGLLGPRYDTVYEKVLSIANGDAVQNDNDIEAKIHYELTGGAEGAKLRELANANLRVSFAGELNEEALDRLEKLQATVRRDLAEGGGIDVGPGGVQLYGQTEIKQTVTPIIDRLSAENEWDANTRRGYLADAILVAEDYQSAYAAQNGGKRPPAEEFRKQVRRLVAQEVPYFGPMGNFAGMGNENEAFGDVMRAADELESVDDLAEAASNDQIVLQYNVNGAMVDHVVSTREVAEAITLLRDYYGDPRPSDVLVLLASEPPSEIRSP